MLGIQTLCDVWASSFLYCLSKQLAVMVHTVLQPWHAGRSKRDVFERAVRAEGQDC